MSFKIWQSINHYTQHNAGVNVDGGAVGLTECPATLQKWMFSRPEMARVIIEFVDCNVRWTGHRFGCLENCRKSSRNVQAARSVEDIPGRCDVNKICDWRIWQSISQIRSDLLVLDIRDAVEK